MFDNVLNTPLQMSSRYSISQPQLRSSHRRCSVKKGVLKKFRNIHIKTPWSLFLILLQAFRPVTVLKRDSNTGVFLKYWKTFKNSYFEEHLRTTAFVSCWKHCNIRILRNSRMDIFYNFVLIGSTMDIFLDIFGYFFNSASMKYLWKAIWYP